MSSPVHVCVIIKYVYGAAHTRAIANWAESDVIQNIKLNNTLYATCTNIARLKWSLRTLKCRIN